MAPNASAALRHAASQSGAGAAAAAEAAEATDGEAGVVAVAPPPFPFALSGLPAGEDEALSFSASVTSATGEDSERCSEGAGDIGGLAAEEMLLFAS
jgi:hypothetical protein